jgi:hypothetical protein
VPKAKNALMPGGDQGTGNSLLDALSSYWQNLNDQARALPAFQPVQNGQLSPFAQSVVGSTMGLVGGLGDVPMAQGGVERLFRGLSAYNKNGKYWTGDREFARNFTQSGQDKEIASRYIKTSDIHQSDPLPFAGDEEAVDSAIKEALGLGKKAIRVDEGAGEPNSTFVFDNTALHTP